MSGIKKIKKIKEIKKSEKVLNHLIFKSKLEEQLAHKVLPVISPKVVSMDWSSLNKRLEVK